MRKPSIHHHVGSSLAVTLVLMSIISIGSLLMARTVIDHQRLDRRRHQLHQAFYAAEAGIALIMHWGNFPQTFIPNPNLFVRSNEVSQGTGPAGGGIVDLSWGLYQGLKTAIGTSGYTIDETMLKSMSVGQFVSEFQYPVSRIREIRLLPALSSDPVPCLFKIRSVGASPDGVERTILTYMSPNRILGVKLMAALISFNDITTRGNGKTHWGEVWAKSTIDILTINDYDFLNSTRLSYDPKSRYRTEGVFNFAANWQWGSGLDLMDPSRVRPAEPPASGNYANAFEQRLPPGTLAWPDLVTKYQDFKSLAISKNRYYCTDASGNIYRGSTRNLTNRISFDVEFNKPGRDSGPYDLVFIDTTNGLPPASDGSNLATIQASNSSLALKGVFWIGAHVDLGSVGNPPNLGYALDSSGNTVSLAKILLDGVMYSAGRMTMGANCGVYGSVVAQRGFASGGGPDIYYNSKLANGMLLENGNVGSTFTVVQQRNY